MRLDLPLNPIDHLIYNRFALANHSICQAQDQVAVLRIDLRLSRPFECEVDDLRVGSGREREIVFELSLLIAVIYEIDAGIDVPVMYLGVSVKIGAPRFRNAADEVMDLSVQLIEPYHALRHSCSEERR